MVIACIGNVFSQDSTQFSAQTSFGFRFGTNYLFTSFDPGTNSASLQNNPGIQLGLVAERAIGHQLALALKSDVSFHPTTIVVSDKPYELFQSALELSTHAIWKQNQRTSKAYLLAGPSIKFDLSDSKSPTVFPVGTNVTLDLGLGWDHALKHFRFAPELVYGFGLTNINRNPTLRSIYVHQLVLVLNFL